MAEATALEVVVAQMAGGAGKVGTRRRPSAEARWTSSGVLGLDFALGGRGLPSGMLVEVAGEAQSGKRTLALQMVARVQQQGGMGVYVDVDGSFSWRRAQALGVAEAGLWVARPESGEAALRMLERLIESGEVALVVVDSLAAMVSEAELAGAQGAIAGQIQARMDAWVEALGRALVAAEGRGPLCLVLNRLVRVEGVVPGGFGMTPGEEAMRVWAGVRLRLAQVARTRDGQGKMVAQETALKVQQCGWVPVPRWVSARMVCEEGFVWAESVAAAGMAAGVVEKRGGRWWFEGKALGETPEAVGEALRARAAVCRRVEEAVRQRLGEAQAAEAFFRYRRG